MLFTWKWQQRESHIRYHHMFACIISSTSKIDTEFNSIQFNYQHLTSYGVRFCTGDRCKCCTLCLRPQTVCMRMWSATLLNRFVTAIIGRQCVSAEFISQFALRSCNQCDCTLYYCCWLLLGRAMTIPLNFSHAALLSKSLTLSWCSRHTNTNVHTHGLCQIGE